MAVEAAPQLETDPAEVVQVYLLRLAQLDPVCLYQGLELVLAGDIIETGMQPATDLLL
jgi:hypothetical protein